MKVCLCSVLLLLNLLTVFGVPLRKENVNNNTKNQPTVDCHKTSFLHGVDRRDIERVGRQCKCMLIYAKFYLHFFFIIFSLIFFLIYTCIIND